MSISNLDYTSYNFLSNLAVVNANEVNTDILTKSDPDISDLQFDMLEGIHTDETIQQQIDNVTVDISTLQSQINTANTNISALQVNMGIAQSDINTLQSEMNTAQSDINDLQTDVGVLYGLTATNTAAIAGLSVSQAAQDVTIAAHTASIASLNTDVFNLQGDVTALEVKTTDQSWGSLSGTTFSSKVNVGGVTLNLSSASTFNNGISASAPITTTSTMSSTSGTSSFNALNVNTLLEVGQDAIIGNTIYVGRTVNSEKKVVLYDNNTDNDYDYTGMWASQFVGKNYFNYEIDGTGGAFRWHYGNGLGNARRKILDINDAEFYSYNATFSFLNSQIGGQTQNITFTDNAFGTFYMNWKTDPDNTASQNRDAAIVVDAGADGVEDDGTMTFVAGAHDMTATTRGISITGNTLVQINAGATGFDVNSTGAVTVDSATTTTLTSVGETEINSAALDINATGAITIDGATTAFMKTANNFNIETTNVAADITFTSSGGFGVDSVGPVNIVTSTNTLFLGSLLGGISQQAEGAIELSSNNNYIALDAGPTSAVNISAGTNVNLTAVATVKSDCADFDVNATDAVTIDGVTIGLTSTTNTILGTTNINSTGGANTTIGTSGTGNVVLRGLAVALVGSTSINDTGTAATTIGNTTGTLQLKGSTNTITGITNINHLNTLATTIGNTTGILTLRGATIINTTGTANTSIGNATGTLTLTGVTTDMNTDLRITQTNYAQPMSSAFQLGYTNTLTGSVIMTVTLAQRATFTLPQKGVWLVVLGYQWTGGASNTVTLKRAIISATTASSTPAAPGLRYYEEMDVGVTATLQQQGTITGVYTATAATTLYLNASGNVNTGTFPTLAWEISWTRIG